jgi:tRNA1Val (adenine37-N6)-methyltransferase
MIRQEKTAMKVGTDGVLLGAWASVPRNGRVLDIGTGTGLLALMIAQRSVALIEAIEINPDAAKQASENIAESPWADRIKIICISFQEFCKLTLTKYDHIVCNPPFFSNSLKAKTHSRSLARHNDQLELNDLVSGVRDLLSPTGHFCVILPAEKESEISELTKVYNLLPSRILRIRPVPGKDFKRVLMDFTFSPLQLSEAEMTIESGARHQYSREYIDLTREFYL